MIILDNYTSIDEKILLDPKTFSVKVVDDSYSEEAFGVGGFVDELFFGIYAKNDLLYFCYNNKIHKANSNNIKCSNIPIDKDKRTFNLFFSGILICDFKYKRDISPIPAFGDDEEEFDFLLYLSNLLNSKDSIDRFIKSVTILNA